MTLKNPAKFYLNSAPAHTNYPTKKVSLEEANKWSSKELETDGSYHEDNGEGLNNFHVGVSRGFGGIAIKKDTTYFSKKYIKWKTITTGPIRTSFYVEYTDWNAKGDIIKESRIISLDYLNYFSKFNNTIKGSNGNSEIGTAIIVPENHILSFEKFNTPITDLNNAYTTIKVINNQTTYFSGFGWKERKEFNSQQEWENYIRDFSKKINSPITTKWE